ncbi:MAG: hypothetical protein NTZ85_01510 [Bacteroidia bacterium]|jgi:hypothetical protein|nr:hypothetical protein [Bacteroidia bacterium]
MGNINCAADVKNAIQLLEAEQAVKEKLLKDQFHLTYESLKPVNLLKSTIKEISSSPYLIDNIIGTATGLATGYISRKIVVGASGNLFRKLFGVILQFGVTNLVASHSDGIRSFTQSLFQHIFHKRNANPEKP